jgi:hypothetical protein
MERKCCHQSMPKGSDMSTFDQQGYLSDDLPEIEHTIARVFGQAFGVSREVSAFAHTVLAEALVDPEDMQRVLSVCLVMRLLEGHESIHILCSKGLTVSSKVTLRSNIEGLILLKYVAANQDNFRRYVVSDQVQRKKWLNIIMKDTGNAFSDELRSGITEGMLSEIDGSISEFDASELKIEQLARKVGLHELYQTAYRMLSYEVHVLPRSLEKYWVLDKAEQVVAMNFTPKNEDILQALVPSTANIVSAIECFLTLLGTQSKYERQLADCWKIIKGIGGEPSPGAAD